MGNRRWTKEEMEYLEKYWGSYTVSFIAKKLNRTEYAVLRKSKAMKLGGCYTATDHLSMNNVSKIMGVSYKAVRDTWVKKGLYFRKKALRNLLVSYIKQDCLLKWLKENTDVWDSRNVVDTHFFSGCDWFEEKCKEDSKKPVKRNRPWTALDDNTLISLIRKGHTYPEIAEAIQRSESSVGTRVMRLKKQGKLPPIHYIKWSPEEDAILIDMDAKGKTDEEIAWELGREEEHVCGRRRRLKNMGKYVVNKKKLQQEKRLEIARQVYSEGGGVEQIASTAGVHDSTVRRWMRDGLLERTA